MDWTSVSKGIEGGISHKEFEQLMNADINLDSVHKRAEKHFTYLMNLKEKFAIISIDMQPTFLRSVKNLFGKKLRILVEYHKKLKQLCKLNSIDFIEIEYRNRGNNVLSDETSVKFDKIKPGVNNLRFFSYLIDNRIRNLLIIGIYRNQCLLNSIMNCFREQNPDKTKRYNLFTSLIGIGSYDLDSTRTNFKNSEYTLKYFLQEIKKLNVQMLDYGEKRL